MRGSGRGLGIFKNYYECAKVQQQHPDCEQRTFEASEYGSAMKWVNGVEDHGVRSTKKRRTHAPFRGIPENSALVPQGRVAKSAIETAHEMEQRYGDGKAYLPWWDEARVLGMSNHAHACMMHEMWHNEMCLGL